ncbi:MAG: hypothetical protein LBU27_09890 [Candidatus Peribacteria bacterium]|nr:hypothetical protein [Candidatus Peribacteria bacterium]
MIQSANKDGKGLLSTDNGHARTEIRDGTQRVRLDATPLQKENGENAGENGMDGESSNSSGQGNPSEQSNPSKQGGETP